MSKYKREDKVWRDRAQTQLAPDPIREQVIHPKPAKKDVTTITGTFMCPFCLHLGPISEYLVSTKKGISQGKALCPECKQGMMMRSLTSEWTPEEFAEWVYPYTRSGFWQKCSFKKFNERLKRLGWSYPFWTRYKQLKGEDKSETYDQYIERKQREEYEERGE